MQVSKSQFKAKALEYFRQVETTGVALVVTDHGAPAVEVRPYVAEEHDPLSLLKHSVLHFDEPLQPVAADDWEVLS